MNLMNFFLHQTPFPFLFSLTRLSIVFDYLCLKKGTIMKASVSDMIGITLNLGVGDILREECVQ